MERALRIIHTADVHLGSAAHGTRLGRAAAALRGARAEALGRVVEIAREREADVILVAGDLFDSARPDPRAAAEALRILSGSPAPVAVIPGNHDPLVTGSVWTRAPWDDPPDNVYVFRSPEPVERPWGLDIVLYPCPLQARDGAESPVAWIREAREAREVREGAASYHIGLAHGTLRITPDIGENDFPIEPDEIARLGLDYLALGHWHSGTDAGEAGRNRYAYSGSPEAMSFGDPTGGVLLVELIPGAIEVESLSTGAFLFREEKRYVAEPQDVAALADVLGGIEDPARTFLRVKLEGTAPLAALEEASVLGETLEDKGFAFVEVDASELGAEPQDIELARVPRGPLRRTLEILVETERAADGEDRQIARRSLALAWSLFMENE